MAGFVASEAKDKIGPPPMCEHVDDLWSGKMTIATDEDVGGGSVLHFALEALGAIGEGVQESAVDEGC